MNLVATCALGLEEILAGELGGLGVEGIEGQRGAVGFAGDWEDCWRANWRLRVANRVLVELAAWPAPDGDALHAGARRLVAAGEAAWGGVTAADLFDPARTFALRATSRASAVRDVRWAALRVKDGIADGQRRRYGRRASVARRRPDLALRLWLHRDRATLLLDTSGEPLDRRGYRVETVAAPVREQLAAAMVLASGWDGRGPVVDPMCGSGTLLAEAGAFALGLPPGRLRPSWPFETLPGFDRRAWNRVRKEPPPRPGPQVRLHGIDLDPGALAAARLNLERAGLGDRATLTESDAFHLPPPAAGEGPGLLAVNPPYGARLAGGDARGPWRRLGDYLKRGYPGWRAVVLAGDPGRGKWIGLKPRRRLPVRNGPLEARILTFELY